MGKARSTELYRKYNNATGNNRHHRFIPSVKGIVAWIVTGRSSVWHHVTHRRVVTHVFGVRRNADKKLATDFTSICGRVLLGGTQFQREMVSELPVDEIHCQHCRGRLRAFRLMPPGWP